MHSIDDHFDQRLPLSHGLLKTIAHLHECRGKEALYAQQIPQQLETLRQAAVIQSTESSNRIEGVRAEPKRLRSLMAEKTTPRDRSEQEIAGYRDALKTIHANWAGMRLTPGLVLQLHRNLFKYTTERGGVWKSSPNHIEEKRPDGTKFVRFVTVAPHLTEDGMRQLCEQWQAAQKAQQIDPLLLIPASVLDFLCIHPFRDGNGRMARLLTLLLLYHSGYLVGRYISLEKLIEDSKDSYYETLKACSEGWHEGTHALAPFTDYLLGTFTAAYDHFQRRMDRIQKAPRGTKSQMVLEAIEAGPGYFTVSSLQDACPGVSVDLIRNVLGKQKEAGRVECLGRGPGAEWVRLD